MKLGIIEQVSTPRASKDRHVSPKLGNRESAQNAKSTTPTGRKMNQNLKAVLEKKISKQVEEALKLVKLKHNVF